MCLQPSRFLTSLLLALAHALCHLPQNRKLVMSVPFFRNCDFNVILKVLNCLQTKMYMPGPLPFDIVQKSASLRRTTMAWRRNRGPS